MTSSDEIVVTILDPAPPILVTVSQTADTTAETARATAAEATLTTNLAAEVTRATAAEGTNATAISTETTRATAAEAAAQAAAITAAATDATTKVGTETTRATAAEALKAPLASPTFTGTVAGITKGMVGLGSVDNTADTAKPVSTAQATADTAIGTAAATDATTKASAAQAFAIQRANHTGTQSADTLTDGTTNKAFLATERTKLTGIATGATANSSDATLLARANHTGTESADVLTDGTTNKAFLATERTKLSGIATGATANSADAVLEARANHTGTQTMSTISDAGTSATLNVPASGDATSGQVVKGSDTRLTDTRTPTDATVTAAKVAATLKPSGSAATSDEALRALGTTASTAAAGNDSRLSDARTPTAHATSHNLGGSDVLTFPTRLLASSTPTISPGIVNTVAKTAYVSLTVPAASVANGDFLTLDYAFDMLNNSGSAVTYTFEFKFGATTLFTSNALSVAASGTRYTGVGRVTLMLAASSDQRWGITQQISTATSGRVLVAASSNVMSPGASAEDLTTDKLLTVSVTMGTAVSTADLRPTFAALVRAR